MREGLALLALLALLLAACEYPGIPRASAAPAGAPSGSRPAPAAKAVSVAKAKETTNVASGTVQLVLKDFELNPSEVTAKAGTVTFVLRNEGRYTHDFRVEGNGVDEKGPKVGSGRTLDWQITLNPGTYRISCPVSNHADRGMVGTLAVMP